MNPEDIKRDRTVGKLTVRTAGIAQDMSGLRASLGCGMRKVGGSKAVRYRER
jgi:hypothetical protein